MRQMFTCPDLTSVSRVSSLSVTLIILCILSTMELTLREEYYMMFVRLRLLYPADSLYNLPRYVRLESNETL